MSIPGDLGDFLAFSPGPLREVRAFWAPGRVNLIGEHLDYNGGLVLPAALTLGLRVFARARAGREVRLRSPGRPDVRLDLGAVLQPQGDFADYARGVLSALRAEGADPPAADLYYAGDLPAGAGLSSSAAVTVGTAMAFGALLGRTFAPLALARLGQEVERTFAHVACGLMDPFAIAAGRRGHAILLDTRRLSYTYVACGSDGVTFVLAHTGVARRLRASPYNERRRQCEAALAVLRRRDPALACLADAEDLSALRDPVLLRRARHVTTEQARARAAAAALEAGRMAELGELMERSHASLRDDYEVTGEALDALADAARTAPGCLGARMTGAGFGGCTVNLVERGAEEDFERRTGERYLRATGRRAAFLRTDLGEGAREVTAEMRRG